MFFILIFNIKEIDWFGIEEMGSFLDQKLYRTLRNSNLGVD